MGANAQTTVPTFTASQVLTADQQNQSARTGVPVFASTVTRDAAFGGTGEKTLAEGQLCYVEGTGLQTYNGTSWVTWGAAPSSGLTLISTTTIGSAVSTVTISNAFSSTYDNYEIIISGGVGSANTSLGMTLGNTATGYYLTNIYTRFSTGTVVGGAETNTASWSSVGEVSTNNINSRITLLNPNLAKQTIFYATGAQDITTGYTENLRGYVANTTQYTAFTLAPFTGTLTGGTIRVYGYQNS